MTPFGIAWRLVVLIAAVVIATWVSDAFQDAFDLMALPEHAETVRRLILVATVVFVVLLAIPFVPGAEIGLTLLTVFGADIAPLVYAATISALMLAFIVGRFVPAPRVVRGLRSLHLLRAADIVEEASQLPREARLARLLDGGAPRLMQVATQFRYLGILVAINVPGNFLIGGGGGIALMAGMSGLFRPIPFFLTVAIAVAPLPLAVLLLGA